MRYLVKIREMKNYRGGTQHPKFTWEEFVINDNEVTIIEQTKKKFERLTWNQSDPKVICIIRIDESAVIYHVDNALNDP